MMKLDCVPHGILDFARAALRSVRLVRTRNSYQRLASGVFGSGFIEANGQ